MCLYFASAVPGYLSFRHPKNGSWFIQSLCDVLSEHAHKGVDLLRMMTMVNRKVALEFKTNITEPISLVGMKQMPSVTSTLLKKVCFGPK